MEDFEKTLIGLLAAQNPAIYSVEFKRSLWEVLKERMRQEEQQEQQEKQLREELDSEDLDMVAAGVRSQKNVKKALFEKGESYE